MRIRILQLIILLVAIAIWLSPVPGGLASEAWQLFAIFIATIFAIVSGAASILLASLLALVVAVLSGVLQPPVAYSGFSEGFILLIVAAFLVGRGVVNSGLGARIGYMLVSRFGTSSLGLAYSVIATDALIAPAFPSNTARSGVLFPIVYSLAESNGSHSWEASRHRLGAFLMLSTMTGLGLSQTEVPIELMAMMLLLATNFFSVMTPQASTCNVIFVGSGYIEGGEVYRYGGLATLACFFIYLVIGTPWVLWVL